MTRRVILHADAAAELEAAAIWYDDRRKGLGLQFLASVDRTLQRAREWPHTGSPVPELTTDLEVRRLPVARFPYHVAYMLLDDAIRILAVAHDRREPGYWKQREFPGRD